MENNSENSLTLLEQCRSLRNQFWFGVRQRLRFSRSGYSESCSENEFSNWLDEERQSDSEGIADQKTLRAWKKFLHLNHLHLNLWTLEILEALFEPNSPATEALHSLGLNKWNLEIFDVGTQDFGRAPALVKFFSRREGESLESLQIEGLEIDAFPLLRSGHSRFDIAQWIVANLEQTESPQITARFRAQDFFSANFSEQRPESARVITAFYPFVSPHPALAWGLPAKLGSARLWIKAIRRNLPKGGLVVMVHQGDWEEQEFDEARRLERFPDPIARMEIDCAFSLSAHPVRASVYRIERA